MNVGVPGGEGLETGVEGEVGDGALRIRRRCLSDAVRVLTAKVGVGGNGPRESDAEEEEGRPSTPAERGEEGILEGGIGDPGIEYNPPGEFILVLPL